jgi:hypothetical protein
MSGHEDCVRGGQLNFSRTIKAHSVRPIIDSEYAAEMFMVAAEDECESPTHKVHSSYTRWRRSHVPLASSHFSRELTVVRARAMEQSAAP